MILLGGMVPTTGSYTGRCASLVVRAVREVTCVSAALQPQVAWLVSITGVTSKVNWIE